MWSNLHRYLFLWHAKKATIVHSIFEKTNIFFLTLISLANALYGSLNGTVSQDLRRLFLVNKSTWAPKKGKNGKGTFFDFAKISALLLTTQTRCLPSRWKRGLGVGVVVDNAATISAFSYNYMNIADIHTYVHYSIAVNIWKQEFLYLSLVYSSVHGCLEWTCTCPLFKVSLNLSLV